MSDIDTAKLKELMNEVNADIDNLSEQELHDIGLYLAPYHNVLKMKQKNYPNLYKLADTTLDKINDTLHKKAGK